MNQSLTPDRSAQEPPESPVPNNLLTHLLERRGTVRNFKPDPVPQAWADAIVEYAMRAPTSSNRQEYSVIQVNDPGARKQIALLATNQQHIVDCPLFFAICADQNRVADALGMHGKDYVPATSFEGGLVASIDAALMGLTMSYVAESFGLSNVLIGAMRNSPVEISKILKLPPQCYVVFGLCVGWAAAPPLPKPRHHLSAVLHQDVYDPHARAQAILDYDLALAAYYRARGVDTVDAAWSQVMSEKYSRPTRPNLKDELKALGFPFE